jgi:hypothetical protein
VLVNPLAAERAIEQITQKEEERDKRCERISQLIGVRQKGDLQRPLKLAVHRSQKAHNEIYERKHHEGPESIALLHIHNI